jgi:ornithine cyclodeaminase/alanine dehydrogenase
MPEVLYLSRGDVELLQLPMGDVVAAVEEGFRLKGAGETEMPPKPALHPGGGAFIHAMPALVRGDVGLAALKWVAVYNTNAARGLPALAAVLVLSDAADGQPLAVMDAALLTALRTGASVGVAARRLARDDVATAGVVGCGVQARTTLAALVEVLPRLSEVLCYDVSAAAARAFVDEMSARFPALSCRICGQPTEVCRRAGVVVSAISMGTGARPPLGAGLLEAGALAVALDYDAAWTVSAMAACDRLVCDDVAQVRATVAQGTYLGELPLTRLEDLGDVVAGAASGRRDAGERIFALNLGIAVDDVMTARLIYLRARERGVGRTLPL